jgi:hypothetical protein
MFDVRKGYHSTQNRSHFRLCFRSKVVSSVLARALRFSDLHIGSTCRAGLRAASKRDRQTRLYVEVGSRAALLVTHLDNNA